MYRVFLWDFCKRWGLTKMWDHRSCTWKTRTYSTTTINIIISLNSLSVRTYADCTISVTEYEINSVTLNISSFTVDPVSPTFSTIYSNDNQSGVTISDNITVTFSESKDNISVITNTDNTTFSGTFHVTSDNFSSCI